MKNKRLIVPFLTLAISGLLINSAYAVDNNNAQINDYTNGSLFVEYELGLNDNPTEFVNDIKTYLSMLEADRNTKSLPDEKISLLQNRLYLMLGESSQSNIKKYWLTDEKMKVKKILSMYNSILKSPRDFNINEIVKINIGLNESDVGKKNFLEILDNQKDYLKINVVKNKTTLNDKFVEAFSLLEEIKNTYVTLDGSDKISSDKKIEVVALIEKYNSIVKN